MRRLFLLLCVCGCAVADDGIKPFLGRWDLTVVNDGREYASWMEVTLDQGTPKARAVGHGGAAHFVDALELKDGELQFTYGDWFDTFEHVRYRCRLAGKSLTGTVTRESGKAMPLSGEPAPALDRPEPGAWGEPVPLFNGKDLTGWRPDDPKVNKWTARDGELVNTETGSNLVTTAEFTDFKLHLEFNCPKRSNSGVYLRGRYEIQIETADGDVRPLGILGAIYGYIAPLVMLPKKAGEWQSLDAKIVGRRVTVALDGTVIIADALIPGPTGGALDSREGRPGPIYLQGDHGSIRFRNITIAPARNAR